MRFKLALSLKVYIYTEEQIQLKKIDDDAITDLQYDDAYEERDFYSLEMVWPAREDPKKMTNILVGDQLFVVKHSKLEIDMMISERALNGL